MVAENKACIIREKLESLVLNKQSTKFSRDPHFHCSDRLEKVENPTRLSENVQVWKLVQSIMQACIVTRERVNLGSWESIAPPHFSNR